jgi:hypothetical protein
MGWLPFYGSLNGRGRTEASRLGTNNSGLTAIAASSEHIAIKTRLFNRPDGHWATITVIRWDSGETLNTLYHGKVERLVMKEIR